MIGHTDHNMPTNPIEIILVVTGALTAGMLRQFVFPGMFTKTIYGRAPSDATGILLARLWG